ncbi:acidic juvenile hormone-suppressible protein 1-like [Anticarsia gemmatalis]|uniref:acidic juvenile hormone-suppressible protein 1-like n=1 Tax=Anticarsia gemmatalis TaxID=129554 RepID=UPI003F7601A4
MARLVLCVLALLVAGGHSESVRKTTHKVADPVLLQKQWDLLLLYSHPHEPNYVESCQTIYKTWTLEKNIEHYSNVTAVKIYIEMLENDWVLPKGVPFSVHQHEHAFEATTLFNVLYSAKDYDTFYKTAVYLREHVNEYLFSYVLTVAIVNRKDTQGIYVPHLYDVFPSFFNNGEVMATAWRIHAHGYKHIDYYPSTYKWDDNVVIRWNETVYPYIQSKHPIHSFTHDYQLSNWYYNHHVAFPYWLGGEVVPLVKDRRGEWFWFLHKQILARYYMERLSYGLGEIPVLGHNVVKIPYASGLVYHSGVPFPTRSWNFHLDQPELVKDIEKIYEYEHRVSDAIAKGYLINHVGEHINLRTPEAIDILGRVIEANVDSPNGQYYKDFISIWKKVLGNSPVFEPQYHNNFVPLVVPSPLEHYQTALRDPVYYMIWKRVLGLFNQWQEQLPYYKTEELALPQVAIQKVEVDKLMTYFENTYMNVTNHLYANEEEVKQGRELVSVLVQRPRLNHKEFQIRVNVNSEVAKTVVVRLFLAPKYDGQGSEIPLHINSQNFFLFDEFVHELPAGESVITRDSVDNWNTARKELDSFQVYESVLKALTNKGQFVVDQVENMVKFPHHLVLPKGRVGGMPYIMMVYISEYRAPATPYGTGFDPTASLGCGSGARYITDEPLGFPVNRPLYAWQVEDLHNLHFQDVLIYHKPTPEIDTHIVV